MSTTLAYRVYVTDSRLPALAGQEGVQYASPRPQQQLDALQLVSLLLGTSSLPPMPRPWRRAIPGGQRTVWLEHADEVQW
jgi:hypothetical protein